MSIQSVYTKGLVKSPLFMPAPSFVVQGNLNRQERLLAEKTNAYASPLILSLGTALIVGALISFKAAVLTGFVLYFVISLFSNSRTPWQSNRFHLPWFQNPPFYPRSTPTYHTPWWNWLPFSSTSYPSSSHAQVGVRRPGTYTPTTSSTTHTSWPSWMPFSSPSYPSSSHAQVGVRRPGTYTPTASSTTHTGWPGFVPSTLPFRPSSAYATVGGRGVTSYPSSHSSYSPNFRPYTSGGGGFSQASSHSSNPSGGGHAVVGIR